MKTVVLTQRFQFYVISPYRDYCRIQEKEEQLEMEDDNLNIGDFAVWVDDEPKKKDLRHRYSMRFQSKAETKKRTKYFYSDKPNDTIALEPWSQKTNDFYTTKERHLKKHYGRPLSQVASRIYERSISVDDESISVRYYTFSKQRGVNCIYFKKSKTAIGFKFNFKTGNIIAYDGTGGKTLIRQNAFQFIHLVINNFFKRSESDLVYNGFIYNRNTKNHPINVEYRKIFNDEEFMYVLSHTFLSRLPHNQNILGSKFTKPEEKTLHYLMDGFVDVNNIKVPNEYHKLLHGWYPTKKYLKKNDNKLIVSILDRVGLKTKSMIKLLHKHPEADIRKLLILAKYFGYKNLHKYIHNIDIKFLLTKETEMDKHYLGSVYQFVNERVEYDIKDSERTCVLKLINELMCEFEMDQLNEDKTSELIRNQINQINDHLSLVTKIREFLPETEMRASNFKDFHTEHIELSKLDRMIKKGYSIRYLFEDKLVEYIEKPITTLGEDMITRTFYPVLLKIDGEYTEEGSHMHHCVATYADRENSIIVSLREGDVHGNERVTNEFAASTKACVQSKYFCNAAPPEHFVLAVAQLKTRVANYKGSIKSISKERVPLVINGVEIIKENENIIDRYIEFNNYINQF